MYGARAARARRFSLLLLEEEEEYVQDWLVTAAWPVDRVAGNWQRAPLLGGRLRLATRSLFFEPDDVRVPIVRIPLAAVKSLTIGPPVAAVAAQQTAAAAAAAAAAGAHHHRAHAHHPGGISPRAPPSPSPSSTGPSLLLESAEAVLMRANMEEVPYTFLRAQVGAGGSGGGGGCGGGFRWAFGPCHSTLKSVLDDMAPLLDINRRPREQRNAALEELSRKRMDEVAFDVSRLQDFGERVVWCGQVLGLTPLVRERGHLAITSARVYFQPQHNIAGDTPVKSHPLAAIAAVARRRSSLRPVGLELFFLHPAASAAGGGGGGGGRPQLRMAAAVSGPMWDAPSAFFAFRSEADREAARHLLTIQPELGRCVPRRPTTPARPLQHPTGSAAAVTSFPPSSSPGASAGGGGGGGVTDPLAAHGLLLEAAGPWLRRVTASWQRGAISNFDYLLYLNFAAGRSFNDLAQWPVFPWVLRNYVSSSLDLNDENNFRDLSKPVGALNPSRLQEFRQRFLDMPHDALEGSVPPFLYGTHYSTPGYVMYWLVRAAPSHMLRLQNGRFDAPDRLFAAVKEAWEGVLHSTTDVKELIPEFFMPGWDFLVNSRRLPLGVRQSGRPVDDVELPPWATDPRDFLAKNRAALESPPVSRQLHAWIDLVFGYKQRGEAAEAADNVFYHLTYEGAVDVAAVTSPLELKALETQINEFGQTPKQLFTTPHPPRLVHPPAPDPATVFPEELGDTASATAAAGGGGGGGGTGYGGEGDAGNRDLALALLSTIMAAAAPEYGTSSPGVASEGADDSTAAAAPSPSASPAAAAAAAALQPGRPAGAPGPPTAAAFPLSGFLKLGRYSQPPPQEPHATSGAGTAHAAAAAAAAARSSVSAMAAAPAAVVGAASALLSSLTGAFHQAAGGGGGDGGGGGGSQRLRSSSPEPCVVAGGGSSTGTASTTSPLGAVDAAVGDEASAPPRQGALQAVGVGSGAEAAADAVAGGSASPGGRGGGGGGWQMVGRDADVGWGAMCTQPFRAVAWSQLTRGSLAAVASGRNGYLYCAGQSGIRVVTEPHDTTTGDGGGLTVVRSAQLDGELLSLALLPIAGGGGGGAAASPGIGVMSVSHPQRHQRLVLLGSHNRKVYAYSPDVGRVVGAFDAHDDAVCCVELCCTAADGAGGGGEEGAAPSSAALVTASWDCSVKIWSLAEGRAPWSTGLSLATCELRDFESGVWALATDPWGGPLLASGTEEGVVALWDTRAPGRARGRPGCSCVWQVAAAADYVGGLALIVNGAAAAATGGQRRPTTAAAAPIMLMAATADGALTLYDIRAGGSGGGVGGAQRLAAAACGAPVRCCAADARSAVAGDESGAVRLWDVGLMAGGTEAVRLGGPEPDGLYPAWVGEEAGGSALCGLDVYTVPYRSGGGGSQGSGSAAVRLATVTEGGRLLVLESGGQGGVGGGGGSRSAEER